MIFFRRGIKNKLENQVRADRKQDQAAESMRLPGGWQLPPFAVHQVLALVIVAVALWAVGLIWLALQGGQQWVGSWQDNVKVHVYIDAQHNTIAQPLQQDLRAIEGVLDVRLVPRIEAQNWLRQWLGGSDLDMVGFVKYLPDSLEVTLTEERVPNVLTRIQDVAESKGTKINEDELSLADAWDVLESVRSIAWFATIVMGMAMALIVSNTLRMILLARAEEVFLMRLMGAKEWFVRLPFVLEGLALGAGAGFLAWLLQWPMLWVAASWLESLNLDLSGWAMLLPLVFTGAIAGGVGAVIATLRIISPENEN